MKKNIHKMLVKSEGIITSFFQKLPEIILLLAIPLALFAYIFVRPQMVDRQNNKMINREINNEDKVDDEIRALMGDVQRDMTNGSNSARLTESAKVGTSESSPSIPKLDLVGPWACESSDKQGISRKLYIESKQIKMITASKEGTEHHLIKEGCLYTWVNNGNGKKQCAGVSEMLSIADLATSTGLIDISVVLGESGIDESGNYADLLASCNRSSLGSFIFTLPQGIKWVEDNTMLEGVK